MPAFQPGPRRRRGQPLYGGSPQPLPQVTTVAVTNPGATSASVVGSINPQGLTGSWWFAYGTTPAYGQTTTVQAISATSVPQTVVVSLSGLTTGSEHWVALIGQTAAGTVTAAPLTFTPAAPQPVVDPSNLPASSATPTVAVPHYQFPISFSPAAGIAVVEQDSLDEVFANVQAIAACQPGECPELPTFGIPDLSFGLAPVDPAPLVAAIQRLEPRASEDALSQALGDPDAGAWQIALTTRYARSGQ